MVAQNNKFESNDENIVIKVIVEYHEYYILLGGSNIILNNFVFPDIYDTIFS